MSELPDAPDHYPCNCPDLDAARAECERLRAKLDEALVAKTRKVVECGVLAGKLHLAEQQRDQWAKDFGDKSEEQADGVGRESVLRARVAELEAALRMTRLAWNAYLEDCGTWDLAKTVYAHDALIGWTGPTDDDVAQLRALLAADRERGK